MQMTMIEALNSALALELERDRRVVLLGQDIGANGGVFRVTEHLQRKFGEERVFDTPLSESAIIGSSIGMAVYGLRPVAEIQFAGFLFVCMNQLVSQAARIRFRSAGAYTCPLVVRAPYGGGVRTPELHSDSLEGVFLQAPGLKVAIPSNPYDAKGLLASAIADPDPVLFLEHIKLYRSFRQETPEEHYSIPLGKAKTVQEGSDVSIFAYGAVVNVALEAAKLAQQEMGTSVEIIDLRTVWPLDEEAIIHSVEKTGPETCRARDRLRYTLPRPRPGRLLCAYASKSIDSATPGDGTLKDGEIVCRNSNCQTLAKVCKKQKS